MQDITIIKSIHPLEIDEKPSEDSINLAQSFLQTDDMARMLTALRGVWRLPPEGLDIRLFTGQDINSLPFYTDQTWRAITLALVQQQLAKFSISEGFLDFYFLALFFNAIIDPLKVIPKTFIEFVPEKKQISAKLHDYPLEVAAIIFPFAVSKQALHNWIDDNWDNIDKAFEESLVKAFPIFKQSENTAIALLIHSYRAEGKTYAEIADDLSKKSPHDDRLKDEGQVRQIHHRFLDQLELFNKVLPQSTHIPQA